MKTKRHNWKEQVVALVAGRTRIEQALTLAAVLSEVTMADRSVTLAQFKAGMVELFEAGLVRLDDYTRAPADIANEPAVIEYNATGCYGRKWYVRGI